MAFLAHRLSTKPCQELSMSKTSRRYPLHWASFQKHLWCRQWIPLLRTHRFFSLGLIKLIKFTAKMGCKETNLDPGRSQRLETPKVWLARASKLSQTRHSANTSYPSRQKPNIRSRQKFKMRCQWQKCPEAARWTQRLWDNKMEARRIGERAVSRKINAAITLSTIWRKRFLLTWSTRVSWSRRPLKRLESIIPLLSSSSKSTRRLKVAKEGTTAGLTIWKADH